MKKILFITSFFVASSFHVFSMQNSLIIDEMDEHFVCCVEARGVTGHIIPVEDLRLEVQEQFNKTSDDEHRVNFIYTKEECQKKINEEKNKYRYVNRFMHQLSLIHDFSETEEKGEERLPLIINALSSFYQTSELIENSVHLPGTFFPEYTEFFLKIKNFLKCKTLYDNLIVLEVDKPLSVMLHDAGDGYDLDLKAPSISFSTDTDIPVFFCAPQLDLTTYGEKKWPCDYPWLKESIDKSAAYYGLGKVTLNKKTYNPKILTRKEL